MCEESLSWVCNFWHVLNSSALLFRRSYAFCFKAFCYAIDWHFPSLEFNTHSNYFLTNLLDFFFNKLLSSYFMTHGHILYLLASYKLFKKSSFSFLSRYVWFATKIHIALSKIVIVFVKYYFLIAVVQDESQNLRLMLNQYGEFTVFLFGLLIKVSIRLFLKLWIKCPDLYWPHLSATFSYCHPLIKILYI